MTDAAPNSSEDFDPLAPAAPMYQFMQSLRSPLTLREMMIQSVRNGYIGQDRTEGPAITLPTPAELFPETTFETGEIPRAGGSIRTVIVKPPPSDQTPPVLVYYPGGGWCVGQAEDCEYIMRKICALTGMLVLGATYRLAPENPFPHGLDDCVTAYHWARQNADELGGDPNCVAVAGDSAGGNMAACTMLRTRDEEGQAPDAAVLLCPVTDLILEEHESFRERAPRGVIYDSAFMGYARGAYARYEDWKHPYVSPARADLRELPPCFIVAGTADPLIDDNRAFANKLREAGNDDVILHAAIDMDHGYYFFPGLLPDEEITFQEIAGFLRRVLSIPGTRS